MNKKTNRAAIGATGAGAGLGAMVGSGVGIAGAFGAVSGVLPLAALGGYLGYKAYKALSKSDSAKDFHADFQSGFTEKAEELREKRQAHLGKSPPKR